MIAYAISSSDILINVISSDDLSQMIMKVLKFEYKLKLDNKQTNKNFRSTKSIFFDKIPVQKSSSIACLFFYLHQNIVNPGKSKYSKRFSRNRAN